MEEINIREKTLSLCAKELEENSCLRDEMATWNKEFGQDGLDDTMQKRFITEQSFNPPR